MNAIDRASLNDIEEYSIPGHPHTMSRKHVKGGAMLDIRGCKFEQLIRDTVKAKQSEPFRGSVSVDIRYNTRDQYIVDVAKSVLDGLNKCAYIDDRQVCHLSIEYNSEVDGVAIKTIGDESSLYIQLPVKAVGKQEPHSMLYAECGTRDKVLQKRLQKTANIMSNMHSSTRTFGEAAIVMDVYTVGCRGDIDNILKFYIESMSMAGVINKSNILSIAVALHNETAERVEIEVLRNTKATGITLQIERDEKMKLKVMKAVESDTVCLDE